MDETVARIEERIEARQRAQREACPPPLRPALERLQSTQAAAWTVFREVSGRLMERRDLRLGLKEEKDEARRGAILVRIDTLDAELDPADEDRRRATQEVAAAAQEWEDAKRDHRVAPVPGPRRAEALALLEEERQTLLRLARGRRDEGERLGAALMAAPIVETRLLFARRDGDEAEVVRLTALSNAASEAAAQLDAGTLAFRERVMEIHADTERRLKALADATD